MEGRARALRPLLSLHDEVSADASAPPGWLTPAVIASAGLYALLFAAWLVLGTVLKPYSDSYSFIFDAWRWRDGAQSFPAYLWEPHVGHHAVWVRLVAALEVSTVRSAWPSVVACTLALLGAAAILSVRAERDGRLTILRLPSALVCAMLVLTGFNALDADQPLNALYPYCLVFSVLSLSLWETGGAKRGTAAIRRAAAMLAAIAAAFGNGAALGLWPVLALMALLSPGRRWLWALAAIGVGATFGVVYLAGAGQIADLGAGGGGADTSPTRRILYLLDYIALPWSQASALAGAALGAIILAVAGWAINQSRLRGPTAIDRFAWSLIGFTVVTAVLAALGRGGLGEALRAPMRYAVFAAPLQAGVVMLLAPEVERRLGAKGWAVAAVTLGAVGLLLVQQAAGGVFVLRSADKIRATIADYEAGRRTPIMTQLIYPDLIFVDRVEQRLRAEGSFGKAPRELAAPASPAAASGGARTP